MPANVECAKRTFDMLALFTKEYNIFFSPTSLFLFSLLLTECSQKKSVPLILLHFSDDMNCLKCVVVKGAGSQF